MNQTAQNMLDRYSLDADALRADAALKSFALPAGQVLLALMLILPNMDLREHGFTDDFRVDWQLLMRLTICAACGLYGLYFLPVTKQFLFRVPYLLMILFGIWSLLTVPASLAVTYSAASCVALWCVILFVPAVLIQLGARRVVQTAFASFMAYIVICWILYYAYPSIGRYPFSLPSGEIIYRLGGNAQELGLQCAWATGVLFVLFRARQVGFWFTAACCAVIALTLIFAHSRTGMLAATAVAIVILFRGWNHKQTILAGLFTAVILTGILFLGTNRLISADVDNLLLRFSRSGKVSEIYTFTGRDEIWDYSIDKALERPFWGHGAGCARQALADAHQVSGYEAGTLHHAHNLFINVFLCTGAIGLALTLLMAVWLTMQMIFRAAPFADVATVMILIAGIPEPMLFGPMPRSHVLMFLLALCWRPVIAYLQQSAEQKPAVDGAAMLGGAA